MSLLSVKKLSKKIKNRDIIKDINFEVNDSEIVGLLGPNGAGKTTTFYSIAGLIKPSKGNIYINNQDITNMPMHERSKLGIAYLPQESSIFQNLSVKDNILGLAQLSSDDNEAILSRFNKVVEEFNLSSILTQKGRELSGGQRRRVEIARCLVTIPKIILMDEPFAGIDPISVGDIQEIIYQLRDKGIGILITDHNYREMLDTCDHSYVLSAGEIIAQGGKDSILANEEVKKVYLGETAGG